MVYLLILDMTYLHILDTRHYAILNIFFILGKSKCRLLFATFSTILQLKRAQLIVSLALKVDQGHRVIVRI